MGSGLADHIYTEHVVRYYMECSGLADPIHTEQSGQVFLPTFTQSSLVRYYMECSGLVDCLYTDTLSFVPTTAGDTQGM